MGLICFYGHSRSGAQSREDVHHGEHGKEKPYRPRRSFTPEFEARLSGCADGVTARSGRSPRTSN